MSERKIVDYHTAEGADSVILRENIHTLFDQGYVLYGNPYNFKDQENEIYLCQAMVKYEEPKTDNLELDYEGCQRRFSDVHMYCKCSLCGEDAKNHRRIKE